MMRWNIASEGDLNRPLLEKLNTLAFYNKRSTKVFGLRMGTTRNISFNRYN